MKHEELIDKIDEQIMENRYMRYPCFSKSDCTTKLRESNNLLGRIKTVLKTAGKEYERGCEDAWEFCRKLELYEHDGGFDIDMQREVFGDGYLIQNIVLDHETYKEALAKVEDYEQKKMREEAERNRIIIGDIVVNECWNIPFIVTEFKNGFIEGIDDNGEPHKFVWPNNLIHKVGSGAGIFDRFKMEKDKES